MVPVPLSGTGFTCNHNQTHMKYLYISSIIITLLSIPMNAYAFSDVNTSHPNYIAITTLNSQGVIQGYGDNTFKPDQPVNRVEALKIIMKGSNISVPETCNSSSFPDISIGDWYCPYIEKAKSMGILSGYPDGTFKPSNTLNKVENLKILLNANGFESTNVTVIASPYADVSKSEWYAPYVEFAKDTNLVDDSENFYPSGGMTRGTLVEAMYRLQSVDIEAAYGQIDTEIPELALDDFGDLGDMLDDFDNDMEDFMDDLE